MLDVIRFHIAFHARDFDKSVHFYETLLGLQRVSGWDRLDEKGVVLSAGGNAAVEIYGTPEGVAYNGPSPSGTDIVFNVSNVDAWYERLKSAGVEIAAPPQDTHWGGRIFYMKDPDGIIVEVFSNLS